MKDLILSYRNENDEFVTAQYDTIMDFIDDMESDKIDIPMLDYRDVIAVFFESSRNTKKFKTIEDCLNHCREIVK